MSKRDSYQLQLRRAAIIRTFNTYIATGLGRMDAYAKTAADFYLSEERVRKIIWG